METRDKDNGIMNIGIVDITPSMLCGISEDTAVTLVSGKASQSVWDWRGHWHYVLVVAKGIILPEKPPVTSPVI